MGLDPNINPRNVNQACPRPELYTAESPQATEDEVLELLAAVVRCIKPLHVLETGTHYGAGTLALARALARNGVGKVFSLEENPAFAQAARARLQDLPVEVITTPARKWVPPAGVRFDVAFFDTSDKRALVEEFRHFHPWLSRGGIVAFHDTGSAWPTREFLRELEREGRARLIDFWTPRGVTLGEVT